jgi:MFS family permease
MGSLLVSNRIDGYYHERVRSIYGYLYTYTVFQFFRNDSEFPLEMDRIKPQLFGNFLGIGQSLGNIIGIGITSVFTEKFGHKKVLLVSYISMIAFVFCLIFCTKYSNVICCRSTADRDTYRYFFGHGSGIY